MSIGEPAAVIPRQGIMIISPTSRNSREPFFFSAAYSGAGSSAVLAAVFERFERGAVFLSAR